MPSGESLVSPVPRITRPLPVSRYTDMVNELETVGEDPNQFNEYGEAPLCVAAYKVKTNEKLKKLKDNKKTYNSPPSF